jgi:hypothetical protein
MVLSPVDGGEAEPMFLERGSLLVLAGDARYKWRHGIRGRKTDTIGEQVLTRGRRVSLTFRTIIIESEQRQAEPNATPDPAA